MKKINLEFYYFAACPYCQIVMEVIDRLNLKVTYKDISRDQGALSNLVNDTGRRTVPCLYIDDKPMHESRDIANWLEKNQSNLEKN